MKHKNFDSVYPYAYFIVRKSDGMKYVGVRYANVNKNLTPSEDFGKTYFTSGTFKKEFKKNPNLFIFRIAYTFDSIEEMWEWEKRITLRVYTKPDWANQGWASNYGDNPEIGRLISDGKAKIKNGKNSIERGAEKLKAWIWNTDEGSAWRKAISDRQKDAWCSRSKEEIDLIQTKRKEKMDFKLAAKKAHRTLSLVGEDGLTGHQRNGLKALETARSNGSLSRVGSERNAKFNRKLGEMSEEEFQSYCEGRKSCLVNSWITRRANYLAQMKVTNSS